ncbi:MAG: glycosyltransferase family 39 protein [bacterium]|nr:glycosyltransferase family 39 protein [bacterium]
MNVNTLIEEVRKEWVLWAIVALAFFLRVVGIGYGLPLSVVYDEAPYTLGALLMIKLHTILPSLHAADFQTVLYYPPYISYVLLAPFVAILGVQYLLWSGDPALFQYHILQDLSPFFITARFLNVLLGTFSVYLVYRIAEAVFHSRVAAAAAAFLLATSLLHIALSMVGRQWIPVSFVFLVVLYLLLKSGWNLRKRYLAAFVTAGIGVGISSISALACILIGLYYLIFDVPSLRRITRDVPLLLLGACIFFALAGIAWLLYHGGNNFTGSMTFNEQKSLWDLTLSPVTAVSFIVFSESVLVALSAFGLIFCAFSYRRMGALIAAFFAVYVAIFYVFFRLDARFILPLVPFLALLGGYAVSRLWNPRTRLLCAVLLLIPLAVALRFGFLAFEGDTRSATRDWALTHLKFGDRVLVYSSALHVPTGAAAVQELRSIDPNVLRKVDEADEAIDRADVPHVLNNLTSLIGSDFLNDLPEYARKHNYEYLILEPRSLQVTGTTTKEAFASLTKDASVLAHFDGLGPGMSVSDSVFYERFTTLFQPKLLGSDVVIYKLH